MISSMLYIQFYVHFGRTKECLTKRVEQNIKTIKFGKHEESKNVKHTLNIMMINHTNKHKVGND